MPDERGNTTTGQDHHSRYRRHKLMTKELGNTIPAIGANDNVDDYYDVLCPGQAVQPLQRLALVHH